MKYLQLALIALLLSSCQKSEGEGGNSSITGKVMLEQWNSTFTVQSYTTEAQDYDVFIVYGDEVGYSDKTETDYQGEYKFDFLREGDYTLYVYSKVTSAEAVNGEAPEDEAIIQQITLGKDEELEAETFTVLDN